jgi:Leucine-rich repeat (LRR) protein
MSAKGEAYKNIFEYKLKVEEGIPITIYKNWNTEEMSLTESQAIKQDNFFEISIETQINRGDVIQPVNGQSFWKVIDIDEFYQEQTMIKFIVKVMKIDHLGNEIEINSQGKAIFNAPVYGGVQVGGQGNSQNNPIQPVFEEKILKKTDEIRDKTNSLKKDIEDKIEECQRTYSDNLDLSNLDITVLPDSLFSLTHLEILDLSKNKIQNLNSKISFLVNLKHLFLGYNKIEFIPIELYELKHLLTLSFKRNRITFIPSGIKKMTSLKKLNISNNLLETLPTEIGDLEGLESLIIYGNRFKPLPNDIGRLNARIDIDDALLLRDAFNEESNWGKGVWKIPKEFRLPIKQYLLFFTEFYYKTKGREIQFEIHDHPSGLELRVKETEGFNTSDFVNSLVEYVNLAGKKVNNEEVFFTNSLDSIEKEILIKDLKNEIRILEMRLENKDFNIHLLEKANTDLYNLSYQLASKPNQILIKNTQHVIQSNYINQHQELKLNFETFIEILNDLKAESRDVILENEVEKMTALIQEAVESKTKDDLIKTDILTWLEKFIDKIEDTSSRIGKTVKTIGDITSKIAKMRTIVFTISDYLTRFVL